MDMLKRFMKGEKAPCWRFCLAVADNMDQIPRAGINPKGLVNEQKCLAYDIKTSLSSISSIPSEMKVTSTQMIQRLVRSSSETMK